MVSIAAALMVVLFASVAVAASLTGTGGRDVIEGTDRAEAISGLGGGDTLNGLGASTPSGAGKALRR
jgi:hypothetical protein